MSKTMKKEVVAHNSKPKFYASGASVIMRGDASYDEEKGTMSMSFNTRICEISEHIECQRAAGETIATMLSQHGVMLAEMKSLAKALEDVADVPQSFYDAIAKAEGV